MIIDFGFSVSATEEHKLKLFCGTPHYMDPDIVKKKEFAEDKFRILKEEITKVVGMSTEVVYEFVESIPLTSTGKYRVTISEVPVSFGN